MKNWLKFFTACIICLNISIQASQTPDESPLPFIAEEYLPALAPELILNHKDMICKSTPPYTITCVLDHIYIEFKQWNRSQRSITISIDDDGTIVPIIHIVDIIMPESEERGRLLRKSWAYDNKGQYLFSTSRETDWGEVNQPEEYIIADLRLALETKLFLEEKIGNCVSSEENGYTNITCENEHENSESGYFEDKREEHSVDIVIRKRHQERHVKSCITTIDVPEFNISTQITTGKMLKIKVWETQIRKPKKTNGKPGDLKFSMQRPMLPNPVVAENSVSPDKEGQNNEDEDNNRQSFEEYMEEAEVPILIYFKVGCKHIRIDCKAEKLDEEECIERKQDICHVMRDTIPQLINQAIQEFEGEVQLLVLDVEDHWSIVNQLGVRQALTILLLSTDGEEIGRIDQIQLRLFGVYIREFLRNRLSTAATP